MCKLLPQPDPELGYNPLADASATVVTDTTGASFYSTSVLAGSAAFLTCTDPTAILSDASGRVVAVPWEFYVIVARCVMLHAPEAIDHCTEHAGTLQLVV